MKKALKNIFLGMALLTCGVTPLAISLSIQKYINANTNVIEENINQNTNQDGDINSGDDQDTVEDLTPYDPVVSTDYLIDRGIAIGGLTIQGAGTEADPYLIGSADEFYYIMNNTYSKINLQNAYVELTADIYLNDETFTQDGQAIGGDGTVYSWKPNDAKWSITNLTGMSFDGKGHSVFGQYDANRGQYSLFLDYNLKSVKNLNNLNICITKSQFVGGIVYQADSVENCTTSGYIVGNASAGVAYIASSVINCTNKVNLSGSQSNMSSMMAGVAYNVKYMKNCANYGDIYGSYECSGIAGSIGGNTLEECVNYGRLTGLHIGGMTACVTSPNTTRYINCKNYGSIKGIMGGSQGFFAGLYYGGGLLIQNCEQYGEYEIGAGGNMAELVGFIKANDSIPFRRLDVVGCKIKVGTFYPLVNGVKSQGEYNFINNTIETWVFNTDSYSQEIIAGGLLTHEPNTIINVRGLNFKIHDASKFNLALLRTDYSANRITIVIESVLIEVQAQEKSTCAGNIVSRMISGNVIVKSFLYKETYDGGERKYYMGDLSGLTYNHKTGRFQSYSQDALGMFYTRLTDDVLTEKGYSKVERYWL